MNPNHAAEQEASRAAKRLRTHPEETLDPAFAQMTRKLPKAPDDKLELYLKQARSFIAATGFYSDVRSTAVAAVAEYIAYQEGYTIRDWSDR